MTSAEGSPVCVRSGDAPAGASRGQTDHRAPRRKSRSPGKEPQASLEFPRNPPRHVRPEGAESKGSVRPSGRGGDAQRWEREAGNRHSGRRRLSAGLSRPRGASPHPARPAPSGAERATPPLPRRPTPPPHASPLSVRRSWICVGRGEARLPFMPETAAALTAAAARRGEKEAGPRAAGCSHRSRAGGSAARAAAGAEEWAGPAELGAGEGGEPGRQRSGPPLTAARRGDV